MNFDDLLVKLDGFDQYYHSELKEILDELELNRKKAWTTAQIQDRHPRLPRPR